MAADGKTDERIRKSLFYSVMDGSFYSAMVGFGESFLPVFAVFMKATNFQLGILSSLPLLLGSLSQLFSRRLLSIMQSRKVLVCSGALLQGFMFIPLALSFFLGRYNILSMLLFACIYWIFGMIINPAWNSWMGDLVDANNRGAYFGKRNAVAGIVMIVTFLGAGFLLHFFNDRAMIEYIGFAILFSLALASRTASFTFLTKKYEPPFQHSEESAFSLGDFIKQAWHRNFGLLALYLCMMNFGVYFAAPFFTPYMLNELNLSYISYTIVIVTALIVKYLTMPVWGKLADSYGTKKVIVVTGLLLPLLPVVWVFHSATWYLILIQMLSGLVWAGFEIASFNFMYDTTSPEKRVACVSYLNVINGIAIFAGALAGGLFVKFNPFLWPAYYVVFTGSFALRVIASVIFLPKLREARLVEHISYKKLLLKAVTMMPTMGIIDDIITFSRRNK